MYQDWNMEAGILDENDAIADHISEHMGAHGILVVNEMGAPGVGKTTTLKEYSSIFPGISNHMSSKVILSPISTRWILRIKAYTLIR